MRTIILSISAMILSVALSTVNAQTEGENGENTTQTQEQREEIKERILELRLDKKDVEIEEREALKKEVEEINQRLANAEISAERANQLKEEAAERRAKNIENRTAIIDNQIALLERNGELGLTESSDNSTNLTFMIGGDEGSGIFKESKEKKVKYDKRTTSNFVIAAGFNNALTEDQSLSDSDYKLAGSRFFEIGWAWKTRVFQNSNFMRVKYGVSFQFNGLKPTDNRYFVKQPDAEVLLEEFPSDLDKSKFRMDNLVFPVHFEFGPSNKVEREESIRYTTSNKFRIGVGGYAGFGLGSRQKLKYEVDGDDIKQKLKGGYNTEEFIYGLSSYIGWGDTSLYAKYDLNPIFKDNTVEQHNFSLGLRFDF